MGSIIQVENLSKRYIIGHQQLKGKKTFREAINQGVVNFGSKFRHSFSKKIAANSPYEEFWALQDISFEIEEGETIGIIGRNGAGKSTLLKVLSRITEPTKGKIALKGRVASLLEVGTGFNGELTGRENIFLNGAILGMHRFEIKKKFDEIVDFSGVEKFLDTPVKRYSSGMYVRLAFAVAAHLEPEILIVDEVLSVGDAEFQKKCLGKMKDVSGEGRTVLFVSHNLPAIQTLCSKTILLAQGRVMNIGPTEKIINEYLSIGSILKSEMINDSVPLDKKLMVRSARLTDSTGKTRNNFTRKEKAFLEIEIEVFVPGENYSIGFTLSEPKHGVILSSGFYDADIDNRRLIKWSQGRYAFNIELPTSILFEGEYSIIAGGTMPGIELLDIMTTPLVFRLNDEDNIVYKGGEGRQGVIMPILDWKKK